MKIILLRTCFPLAGDEASTDGEAEGDGQVPVAVKEGTDDIVGAELIVGVELMVVGIELMVVGIELMVVGIELIVGRDFRKVIARNRNWN
jgi:hypothetical protein